MINLEFLEEISTIIQKGLGSDETFSAVFDLLEKTLSFDSATLFLYDETQDKLEVIHQKGEDIVELAGDFTFARGRGISSWVSQLHKPVILESLARAKAGLEHRFCSFVSMPLRAGDKLIGVLNLGHQDSEMYLRKELPAFEFIARQISMVMDKIILQSTLQEKNAKLEKALTELKDAQNRLVEQERLAAIGEIVVTVNHEINNPLTSIISLSEILQFTYNTGNKEKIQSALKSIHQAAKKIQRVTERLRHINKSQTEAYHGSIKMTRLPS